LSGGASISGEIPSSSGVTMRFAETRFQCRSTASAGLGSCALSTRSIAARADFSAGSSSERCGNAGAKPAATSSTLRSRNGTSNRSASFSTMSREGAARPVSTKLK